MIAPILLVNVAVIFALALVLFGVARRNGDPSFIDPCWGLGFVVIAWVSFATADAPSGRGLLLALMTSAWGLRLGGYLFWRWRKHGADPRYEKLKDRMFTHVFLLQAVLMLVVSLPLQFGMAYAANDGASVVHVIGVALVGLGLFFEWTGDFQLTRFKADPANKGQVIDRGLWRYTRHPNYFGDFCVWWGLFLVSTSTPVTLVSVIGPLVMSTLLMRVSGVALLEKQLHDTKPKYKDYVKNTSAFFPRPPRSS